jgi:RNA polymerase sigma-70 factor (ECF subfamily)
MVPSTDKTNSFMEHFLKAEPRVYAYIRSQIFHKADAEDVLQETAVTLWEKFESFQQNTDFLAWAYQVTRFKVQHYYKKRTRQHRLFSQAFSDLVARKMEGMESELSELNVMLAECMKRLSLADREVVQRCYTSEATVAMVAGELGRPIGTVKNVLKRSRRALYECILRGIRHEDRL